MTEGLILPEINVRRQHGIYVIKFDLEHDVLPEEYWINKLEVHGFGYDGCLSTQWQRLQIAKTYALGTLKTLFGWQSLCFRK